MAEGEAVLDADNAVQASILLLAADGAEPVASRTRMRMMVFYLLKHAGPIAGRGLGGTDAHMRYDSGDVDAELRRLAGAGAVRCGSTGIEATESGRDAADALAERLGKRAATMLRNTKEFYNSMTDDEALVYARAAYPGAAGRQDAPEGDEPKVVEDVLFGLIDRGIISTGHAARLLHRSREDVMRMVSAAGIPVLN